MHYRQEFFNRIGQNWSLDTTRSGAILAVL